MTAQAEKQLDDLKRRQKSEKSALADKAAEMRKEHRAARDALRTAQDARTAREEFERADRLRKGIRGLWQRLTGEHGRIAKQNQAEAEDSARRDAAERDALRHRQLDARAELQTEITRMKAPSEGFCVELL